MRPDDLIVAALRERMKRGSFSGVDEILAHSLRGRRVAKQYEGFTPVISEAEYLEVSTETLLGLLANDRA